MIVIDKDDIKVIMFCYNRLKINSSFGPNPTDRMALSKLLYIRDKYIDQVPTPGVHSKLYWAVVTQYSPEDLLEIFI